MRLIMPPSKQLFVSTGWAAETKRKPLARLRVKTKYGSGRGIPPLRMISYAVTGRQVADGEGILVKLDTDGFPES